MKNYKLILEDGSELDFQHRELDGSDEDINDYGCYRGPIRQGSSRTSR